MSYSYEIEKPKLFTEQGQVMFLQIRDNVQELLEQAGAVKMDHAITGVTGDSWQMLACLDRLVELGEIEEISRPCAGQDRVFVKKWRRE